MPTPVPVELEGAAKAIQMALQAQGDVPPDFDFDLWLQKWLLMPQPALGGSRPVDLLDTADGSLPYVVP